MSDHAYDGNEFPLAYLITFRTYGTWLHGDLVMPDQKVWSRGGSTRYLWKPGSVDKAIDYTINQQGPDLSDR